MILRTDAVSKVLRPSILLRLTLSDGDVRTMEASFLVVAAFRFIPCYRTSPPLRR